MSNIYPLQLRKKKIQRKQGLDPSDIDWNLAPVYVRNRAPFNTTDFLTDTFYTFTSSVLEDATPGILITRGCKPIGLVTATSDVALSGSLVYYTDPPWQLVGLWDWFGPNMNHRLPYGTFNVYESVAAPVMPYSNRYEWWENYKNSLTLFKQITTVRIYASPGWVSQNWDKIPNTTVVPYFSYTQQDWVKNNAGGTSNGRGYPPSANEFVQLFDAVGTGIVARNTEDEANPLPFKSDGYYIIEFIGGE